MSLNDKEKKLANDAIFIAITDLMGEDKEKAINLALLGFVLRHYIRTSRLPKGQLKESDVKRQIVNLLIIFLEKTHQKIVSKGQIPEVFTPLKFVLKVEAQIDPEGTTIDAHTVKINVTPEMLSEVNKLILKLGHEA